jgi:hypothetical protein
MFVRTKNNRRSFVFHLVESARSNGVPRQRVVLYLGSISREVVATLEFYERLLEMREFFRIDGDYNAHTHVNALAKWDAFWKRVDKAVSRFPTDARFEIRSSIERLLSSTRRKSRALT